MDETDITNTMEGFVQDFLKNGTKMILEDNENQKNNNGIIQMVI